MKHEKKMLSTRALTALGLKSFRATAGSSLVIVILGMIVPQLLLAWALDARMAGVVEDLRSEAAARGAAPGGFEQLIAVAIAAVQPIAAGLLGITIVVMTCYFALVHVAVHQHRGQETLSPGKAMFLGLKTAAPAGVVVLATLFFMTLVGQVVIAPAVLIAVLSLVVPVILVAEGKGAMASLWDALTLRYARRSAVSGWSVLFALLTLGALFYTALALVGMASRAALGLDIWLGVGRGAWSATFSGLPFGPVYVAISILEISASTLILGVFPALTTALYFSVVGRRDIGRA